ncbi:hypothetical protein GO988_11245 [Hymenobacter sp. HMF4947]|uniref:Uncharacterized protein n=1 Tax=Hymenobacter ginkgonis TaxID=2682976 RepID=A0A7K1TER1_9BACT|nr:hypothetical protein [Hymenobacter ginkgonis]MVN76899.1 hypothetical protein [Hymenobacter ginkgonis]
MRKLVVLFALSLTTSAAWAQADKNPSVTKLPGEESLSIRERAERDFLMPVRRKKAAEMPKPTASAEQLNTSAPETDAEAHYNEAAPDPRTEETVAVAHEAGRSKASRHAAWVAARRAKLREERAEEARAERRAEARRSSKSSKASRTKEAAHSSKAKRHTAEKASAHHSSKKATTHKTKKETTKKTVHHTAAAKAKTKTKTKTATTKHKHRR